MENYRSILLGEFAKRKKQCASLSLRGFSRRLAISPAHLSQILSGKRPLSMKTAAKIAERLALSPGERRLLFESLVNEKLQGSAAVENEAGFEGRELDEEKFRFISEWYHVAILSLLEIRGAKLSPKWIARRIGITVPQAAQALRRLNLLGLISIHGNKAVLNQVAVKVEPKQKSAAITRFHQQVLARASEVIESAPVEQREFRALSLALDPKKLDVAREKIRNFLRQLSQELESGDKREVYLLSLQLFPVAVQPENSGEMKTN